MKRFLMFLAALLVGGTVYGATNFFDGNLSSGAVAYTQNFTLFCPQVDRLSLQATYFPSTLSAVSFTDGIRSTGTITVSSNTALTGAVLTVNGQAFTQGVDWATGSLSSNTALNIYNVISSTYSGFATGTLIVNSTYSITGSSFALYGSTFIAGTSFSVGNSTITTATNILNAIVSAFSGTPLQVTQKTGTLTLTYCSPSYAGNSTMVSYSSSYTVTGMAGGRQIPITNIAFNLPNAGTVIYATATTVGVNSYVLKSSTPTALIVAGISGGIISQINYAPATISATNTFPTGMPVLYTVSVGTSPTGLVPNTTYYTIAGSSSYFQLASSQANAVAGNFIPLSKANYDNKSTLVLTPLAITGTTWYVVLQGSDDGDNFFNLSVSSITSFAGVAGSQFWDLSWWDYKYLRASLTAGTSGAVNMILRYLGKY